MMFTPQQMETLNKKELQVLKYIQKANDKVGYMRIREVAQECGVSTTTILRFIKKMGYADYNEFKFAMRTSLKEEAGKELNTKEIAACLEKLSSEFYEEKMEEALELIRSSDIVIFLGIGNSAAIARYGARCFSNNGIYALFQDDPFYNTDAIKGNVCVVVLSISGKAPELLPEVEGFRTKGCKTICITAFPDTPLARMTDLTIAYYLQSSESASYMDFSTQIPAVYVLEKISSMAKKGI